MAKRRTRPPTIQDLRSLAAKYRLHAEKDKPETARVKNEIADGLDREARMRIAFALLRASVAGATIYLTIYMLLALLPG